jgi:serine/threonine-protein kinase
MRGAIPVLTRALRADGTTWAPLDLPATGATPLAAGEATHPTATEATAADAAAPRRRRRRGRLLAALLVVLALLGGGGALAATQPWKPTVAVPDVTGLPLAAAKARLAAAHLGVRVGAREDAEQVPEGDVVRFAPARQREGRAVTLHLSSGPAPRTVPSLQGRQLAEAEQALADLGLRATQVPEDSTSVPAGTVLRTDPPAGALAPRGSEVKVITSAGPPAVPLPDLTRKPYDQAVASLQALQLGAVRVDAFDDTVPAGRVVSTNPAAGQALRPGQVVAVTVSKGPDLVVVPDVAGKSPDGAAAALRAVGFSVSATYGPPGGTVFSTQPAAGTKARRGSQVSLYTR